MRRLLLFVVLVLLVSLAAASCGAREATPSPTPAGTPPLPATLTPTPTLIQTPLPATQTPILTRTPATQVPPTPTTQAPPTPTSTEVPQVEVTPGSTVTRIPRSTVKSITLLTDDGGRLDWSNKLDLITFDREGEDGYFDVWTMKPDGSQRTCVTCDNPELPGKHMGLPEWQPSGDYIVFQAEKAVHPGGSIQSRPGVGIETNIWAITKDGSAAFQLTDLPDHTGTLHPHFSHDGSMLFWSQMIIPPAKGELLGGEWALKVADFIVDASGPRLANTRTFQPGDPVFYESHGFSVDDSKIIFSGNLEPDQPVWGLDIYTMDLLTDELENLTSSPDEWDEHADISPSGQKIVWASSKGCGCDPSDVRDITLDLWIMNADGSGKTRLTHFSDSAYPERMGDRIFAADSAWNARGDKVLVVTFPPRGLLEALNLKREKLELVVVEFDEPQ